MENFIKDNWPEILSIIGAAAWLPIVFVPLINAIINHFRKLQATVLDARVLSDGKGISVGKKSIKTGTILLFVSNLFIKKTTIFAKNISIKVKLNNGAQKKKKHQIMMIIPGLFFMCLLIENSIYQEQFIQMLITLSIWPFWWRMRIFQMLMIYLKLK